MIGNGTMRRLLSTKGLLSALVVGVCVFAMASSTQAVEMNQGWWLQIKEAACAKGPTVLLGDIAVPQGDMPASTWAELAVRPLWNAPDRAGRQTALTRERLIAMLHAYAEDIESACTLPSQLVVQRGGKVIEGPEVRQRLVDYLTERGAAFKGELELKDLHGPDYIFLTNERDQLVLEPSSRLTPGRVNLLFDVKGSDGKSLRRYAASAFVSVWRALPVPILPMNRLETVNLANVQFKRRNLAYYKDAWDGTGGPWRMVRSVGTDQVLRLSDIEPVPVIAKGDKVNLVFQGENIRLQVKAEALSDGGIGQKIQVRNLQSKRKILAIILDAQSVQAL
jgi:flagellar basal body P-ring formation protein FlgA